MIKKNQIAIVTGASSGMGKEFVNQISRLYQHLDEIWVVARRKDRLEKLQETCTIPLHIIPVDLLTNDGIKAVKRELKQSALNGKKPEIRMLVNSAGIGKNGPDMKMKKKTANQMIALNCSVPVNLIHICIPYMSRNTRIINLVSAAAFCPQPDAVLYAATKAFLLSYSRGLAKELEEQEIYVTAVCPGPVDTEFLQTSEVTLASWKEKALAHPKDVVYHALCDSVNKKQMSVYGIVTRASQAACKVIPHSFMLKEMKRLNERVQE